MRRRKTFWLNSSSTGDEFVNGSFKLSAEHQKYFCCQINNSRIKKWHNIKHVRNKLSSLFCSILTSGCIASLLRKWKWKRNCLCIQSADYSNSQSNEWKECWMYNISKGLSQSSSNYHDFSFYCHKSNT